MLPQGLEKFPRLHLGSALDETELPVRDTNRFPCIAVKEQIQLLAGTRDLRVIPGLLQLLPARARGEELEKAGYHAQIARTGQELNLFLHGDAREAIRVADGKLRLVESGTEMEPRKLLESLREHPENASPGVLLRPLM